MGTTGHDDIRIRACDRCGEQCPASLLVSHKKSFYRGHSDLFVPCLAEAGRREDYLVAAAFLCPLVLVLVPVALPNLMPGAVFFLDLAFSVSLFLLMAVPVHELAHCFATLAVGAKVSQLDFGSGRPLFALRFGELLVNVRPLIGSGACWMYCRDGAPAKWKRVVISVAGPLSNLALAIVAPALLLLRPRDSRVPLLESVWVFVFVAANLAYFLMSIIPRRRRGRAINDGAQIVDHLRHPAADEVNIAASYRWIQIEARLRDGDHETAREIMRKAIRLCPKSVHLLEQDMRLKVSDCQWVEIQATLPPLASEKSGGDILRYVLPYLVLANLHKRTPEALAEAEALGMRILREVPRLSLALAVYGLVLRSTGQGEKGLELLMRALHFPAADHTRALIHLTLAGACDDVGCSAASGRHRSRALALDPRRLFRPECVPRNIR